MKPNQFDSLTYSIVDLFEKDDHSESETYHESTKLNRANAQRLGFRVGQIKQDPHIVRLMTRAWKTYTSAERIALPPGNLGGVTMQQAVERRRSISSGGGVYSGEPMTLQQLASVLHFSYGVTHSLNNPKNPEEKMQLLRATTSAGGLYPLEIYPIVFNMDGLAPGIYHYDVAAHSLDVLRREDVRETVLKTMVYYDMCAGASVILAVSGILKRTLTKYLFRGYRFLQIDVGALVQSLYLSGSALDLATCAIGGFFDDELGTILGLNNVDEHVMICFNPRSRAAVTVEPTASTSIHELARMLVSPQTGIIRRLLVLPRWGGDIPLAAVAATLPDYSVLPGGQKIDQPGGDSPSLETALTQVVFETIERYCGGFVGAHDLVWSRPGSNAFIYGPSHLPLYSDEQYDSPGFPFRRLTERSSVAWVRGRRLRTGEMVHVPAALTFVPYITPHQDEWIGYTSTTGMAASWSWERACLTGLLEVCERDAFAIMWHNALSMPRLRVDETSPVGRWVSRMTAGVECEVAFVNITSDIQVPVVLAILRRRALGRPIVTVGVSCKPTFSEAIMKAFAEAAAGYVRVRDTLARPGPHWAPEEDFSNVTTFEHHGLVYAIPQLQLHLAFLTASPVEQPVEQPIERHGTTEELLSHVIARAQDRGLDPIVIDLTTPDIGELGVHALKVFCPTAVPVSSDHRYPWLGHSRLYTVPQALGYRDAPSRPESLNRWPHPFA